MVTIRIPTPLRPYTDGNATVEVHSGTVGSAIKELIEKYPELGQHLLENGKLRSFVNIFLDGEDVRYLDGEDTVVPDGATLMIIPSIAGG